MKKDLKMYPSIFQIEKKVKYNSYMDFYLSVKYEFDQALLIQPSGVNSKTMIMPMLNLFNN